MGKIMTEDEKRAVVREMAVRASVATNGYLDVERTEAELWKLLSAFGPNFAEVAREVAETQAVLHGRGL